MTAARGAMTLPSNRDRPVRHRRIALLDHVRRHVRMLRARHMIALACDKAAVVAHRCRASHNLATVVGVVVDSNKVHHKVIY